MILLLSLVIVLQAVLFRTSFEYSNFTIANVVFSPEHAKTQEVQSITSKGRRNLLVLTLLTLGLFMVFQFALTLNKAIGLTITLLGLYPIVAIILLERSRGKLIKLKEVNHWVYDDTKRSVSLKVSAEKGRSAPAILWHLPITLLAVLPLVYLFIRGKFNMEAHFSFLFLPFISLLIFIAYPTSIKTKSMATSPKEEVDLAYHRNMERINGWTYLGTHFIMILFPFLFVLASSQYLPQGFNYLVIAGQLLSLILLFLWRQTQQRNLIHPILEETQWYPNESRHFNRWGFYNNPDDPRLMVPKQNPGLGTTINLGKKAGKILAASSLFIPLIIIPFVLYISMKGFTITPGTRDLKIDAPMYGQTLEYENIEAVSLSDEDLMAD